MKPFKLWEKNIIIVANEIYLKISLVCVLRSSQNGKWRRDCCSDRLVCIVVGHGYVKHVNIVRGNIKASRNTSTLTERAPASSRQVTSWHRVIGWLALAVQYCWRRVRFHWPDRVGCRASFTVYAAKVPQKRRPLSFVFISWKKWEEN